MHIYTNKRWRFIFTITFVCLFCATSIAFTYGYINRDKRLQNEYEQGMTAAAQKLMEYANQAIESATASVNAVFRSNWFSHYRNVAGIYADEFNVLKRIEIKDDLASKVAILPVLEDILVITPAMDSVISKNGWFTLERYESIYGNIKVTSNDGYLQYPNVECINDEYAMLIVNDPTTRRNKTVACVLFSCKRLSAALNGMLNSNALGLSVTLNGREVCSFSADEDDSLSVTLTRHSPELTANIYFPSYEDAEGIAVRCEYMLEICLSFAVSIILAALLASITTRPMYKMIRSFGGKAHDMDNPYQFIYEYVAAYSQHADMLQMQVDHLDDARNKFLGLMRNEIFYGILTNPDFNFSDEYITSLMPWICDGVPCLLAIFESAIGDTEVQLDEKAISGGTEHMECADIFGAKCIFLWYDCAQTADVKRTYLANQYGYSEQLALAISDVIMEPEEFHTEYARLHSELQKQRSSRENMPVMVQITLIESIRHQNIDACLDVLSPFVNEDNMLAPMYFLMRFAHENGINTDSISREFSEAADADSRKQVLFDVLKMLITPSSKQVSDIPHDDKVDPILDYIRSNFNNVDLCVNIVADKFNMHRTQVSKLIKSKLGITFSEYVQTLRLERAASLIESGERSLNDIATDVGYASYSSFKRAFIRCNMVSPREYREHLLYSDKRNI